MRGIRPARAVFLLPVSARDLFVFRAAWDLTLNHPALTARSFRSFPIRSLRELQLLGALDAREAKIHTARDHLLNGPSNWTHANARAIRIGLAVGSSRTVGIAVTVATPGL